jgi:hypothetical protein
MDNLAVALKGHGKYEAAEKIHRRALELREKVLAPGHPDTIRNAVGVNFQPGSAITCVG